MFRGWRGDVPYTELWHRFVTDQTMNIIGKTDLEVEYIL